MLGAAAPQRCGDAVVRLSSVCLVEKFIMRKDTNLNYLFVYFENN